MSEKPEVAYFDRAGTVDHLELVREILALAGDFAEEPLERIDASMTFQTDLGMDSARAVEFLCELEERFSIDLDEEEMIPIVTVGEMITAVEGVLRKQQVRQVLPERGGVLP